MEQDNSRLPKTKRYADDTAPTLEEIQKIVEYSTGK